MTHEDEIILEQYFPYKNMTIEERNFFINLFINSKDVSDSEVRINKNSDKSYKVNYLGLNKEKNIIRFEAIVSNSSENRMISGFFKGFGNKMTLVSSVYRCSDVLDDDDKDYKIIEDFVFEDDKVFRKSRYLDGRYYESKVDLYSDDEMEEYIQNITDEYKLKR